MCKANCSHHRNAPEGIIPVAQLDDWARVGNRLHGTVTGHDDFEDGTRIITGTIQSVSFDGSVATTRNTMYVLGNPA